MPWNAKALGLGAAVAMVALLAGAGTAVPASSHDGHAAGSAAPPTQHQGHAGKAAAPAEAAGDHGNGYGHGAWPKPESLGGDFSLTDHTGRRVTLADFRGKALAVYFGYTNCDDICPLIGTKLGRAIDLMGDKGDRVDIAVISVDDRRDGPAEMAAFVSKIHPRLIGLSGTRREIHEVAAKFRVRRDHVPTNQVAKPGEDHAAGAEADHAGHGSGHGSDAHAAPAAVPVVAAAASDPGTGRRYRIRSASEAATQLHNMALAHSTHIYLIDRSGQVRNYIYPGMSPEQMAKRLTDLADGG